MIATMADEPTRTAAPTTVEQTAEPSAELTAAPTTPTTPTTIAPTVHEVQADITENTDLPTEFFDIPEEEVKGRSERNRPTAFGASCTDPASRLDTFPRPAPGSLLGRCRCRPSRIDSAGGLGAFRLPGPGRYPRRSRCGPNRTDATGRLVAFWSPGAGRLPRRSALDLIDPADRFGTYTVVTRKASCSYEAGQVGLCASWVFLHPGWFCDHGSRLWSSNGSNRKVGNNTYNGPWTQVPGVLRKSRWKCS